MTTDDEHFHVWIRSGRVFTLRPKVYNTRQAALKAATQLRSAPVDRMVRACETCPPTARSRRPRPRPLDRVALARRLSAALELPVSRISEALDSALPARIR